MSKPSEQALPFSEAAREAAAKAIHGGKGCTCRRGARGDAKDALTAAVDADPRAKACLKLATLSDEELRRRIVLALYRCVEIEEAADAGADLHRVAAEVLAALLVGLSVGDQETTG